MTQSPRDLNTEAFESLGVYEDRDQRLKDAAASAPIKIVVTNHNRVTVGDGIRFGIGLILACPILVALSCMLISVMRDLKLL